MIRLAILFAVFIGGAAVVLSGGSGVVAADGCSLATPTAGTPAPVESSRITIGEDEALFWAGGDHAVLLAHGAIYDAESWRPQAEVMAAEGYTVLSLERTGTDAVLAGIEFLQTDCGVTGITVIGASAGVSGSVSALAQTGSGIDGLVVLAGSGDFQSLGDFPKLFVASEGEGMSGSLEELAANAPGDENAFFIVPGSAHAQAVFLGDEAELLLDEIMAFLDAIT